MYLSLNIHLLIRACVIKYVSYFEMCYNIFKAYQSRGKRRILGETCMYFVRVTFLPHLDIAFKLNELT